MSQIFLVGGTIGSVVPLIGPTTASDWLPLYLAKTDNFIFYRLIGILNGHFIYRIELAMVDYPYTYKRSNFEKIISFRFI